MAPQKKRYKARNKGSSEDEINNNNQNKKSKPGDVNGIKDENKDSASEAGLGTWASGHLFHGYSIHLIVFLVLITRLVLANDKTSWWFIHPDESYHAIEVAHSEVYGYGFRSFEFFPDVDNDTDSQYQLHRHVGMLGTKSWLPVRFYAFFLRAKESLGIPTSPFQLTKTIHISVAGLLPVAIFKFVRNFETSFPNDVASIAAIIVAFTDYFVLLGTHTFLESLVSPIIFFSLAYIFTSRSAREYTKRDNNFNKLDNSAESLSKEGPFKWKLILAGFLLGLSIYAKPDSIVTILCSTICLLPRSFRFPPATIIVGLSLSVMFCSWEEYQSYGHWFSSPVRWWKFRFHSHKVFGSSSTDYYFSYILNTPIILTQAVCSILSVIFFVFFKTTNFGERLPGCQQTINYSLTLLTAALLSVSILSYFPHKDVRYLHDALALLTCSSAASVFILFRFARKLLLEENQEKLVVALKLFIYAEALMFVVRSSAGYPSAKNRIIRDQVLVPDDFWESSEVSACLDFVDRQKDVSGLVLDFSIHRISGFTGIHKKVPLLAKTFNDFREWKLLSARNLTTRDSTLPIGNKNPISVHSFDDVTNFFAEENGLLVLKYVIEHPHYNYAILTRNRKFPHVGYRPMLRVGNTTVFKRIKSKRATEELRQVTHKLVAKNVSVLLYEARWLVSLHLRSLAVQRMELAVAIDQRCVACWQILYSIYKNTNPENASWAKKECFDNVGPQECGKKTKLNDIHKRYSLGVMKIFVPDSIS